MTRIEINLDYVTLDSAIAELEALREEYGGKSIIDVSMEREPYDDHDHVEITLIKRGE